METTITLKLKVVKDNNGTMYLPIECCGSCVYADTEAKNEVDCYCVKRGLPVKADKMLGIGVFVCADYEHSDEIAKEFVDSINRCNEKTMKKRQQEQGDGKQE